MSSWTIYDDGKTIGAQSPENAIILADEAHEGGARITLKRGENYLSVSLKIHGWIDHTYFAAADLDAQREYRNMRSAALPLLELIAAQANEIKVWEAVAEFVRRFS